MEPQTDLGFRVWGLGNYSCTRIAIVIGHLGDDRAYNELVANSQKGPTYKYFPKGFRGQPRISDTDIYSSRLGKVCHVRLGSMCLPDGARTTTPFVPFPAESMSACFLGSMIAGTLRKDVGVADISQDFSRPWMLFLRSACRFLWDLSL